MKTQERALFDEDWWLDYLEGEASPQHTRDLELVQKNSVADRRSLEILKRTKSTIRESDNVALPESGLYYEELHSRIMHALAAEAAGPAVDETSTERWAERRVEALAESSVPVGLPVWPLR